MSQVKAMFIGLVLAFVVGAVFTFGQSTRTPGEPTQARVWIQNRTANDAVPVAIERFSTTVILPSRAVRQQWEYRTVRFDDSALMAAGNEGWEAVAIVGAPGVLMKRPK